MKSFIFSFAFMILGSFQLFAQSDIIEKVFSDKSTEFKASIEIIDTIEFVGFHYDPYYYTEYTLRFGDEGFKYFLIYKNKQTGKKGLIVYGSSKTAVTEAVADSISYLSVEVGEYHEIYDENGLYLDYYYDAQNILFEFSMSTGSELWSVSYDGNYAIKKDGKIKRGLFRAVEFTEHVDEFSGSSVTAVFANLENNKILRSSVLDRDLVRYEVYAYHYDYYGEYDYYYDYSATEADYSLPSFESRLNYEPVILTYIEKGDTIYNLIKYDYPVYNENAYTSYTLPQEFNGVWCANKNTENEEIFILNRDEIYSAYSILYATIDAYKGCYTYGTNTLEEALTRTGISSETKNQIISKWNGDKSNVKYLSFSSWTTLSTFREFIFFNDAQMMRVKLSYQNQEIFVDVTHYNAEKVYHKNALSRYDQNNYTTVLIDETGKKINLPGEIYFYNYALSVSKKNIDADGNLILTNESLGNIHFKGVNYGNEYLGKLDVQWINDEQLSGDADIVSIKTMPFNIKDESGVLLCSDVNYMYVTNAQGFNLYQVTNSNGKVGVLGPDGTWMIKQEWDAVTILGPAASQYSESIGLPVFFVVYSGEQCGAMDSKGNFIIPMGHNFIEVCSENLIAHKDGKVSFYSFEGKLLMGDLDEYSDTYYYSADCYSLDYTHDGNHVLVKNGKYGLVDKNFKTIIPFEYDLIMQNADLDAYIVADTKDNYGLIKSDGTVILPMEYSNIYSFDYSPNRLIVTKDNRQGVVNEKGEIIIPIEFYTISSYSDWNSNLIEVSDENYRTNIVDTTGKPIIDATCEYFYYYTYYQLMYCANQGKFDFYDLTGQLLYSKLVDYIDPYDSYETIQIYQVGNEDPKFGAFDISTGEDLMLPDYESLYPFWIGDYVFFAATINGKLGIYDSYGVELVKPKGLYLDNYYYDYDEYGNYQFFVEISNKKGKSKIINLNYNL